MFSKPKLLNNEKTENNLYRTMTLRDQIEARTNEANTSAVWKHLKLSTQTSLQARNTDSKRLLSAASHVSGEKRKGGCCWLLWWLKSRNGLKRLVNKLQNVLFFNTHTNCISYSNSSCTSSRHQGSKSKARGTSVLKTLNNCKIS